MLYLWTMSLIVVSLLWIWSSGLDLKRQRDLVVSISIHFEVSKLQSQKLSQFSWSRPQKISWSRVLDHKTSLYRGLDLNTSQYCNLDLKKTTQSRTQKTSWSSRLYLKISLSCGLDSRHFLVVLYVSIY